MKPEMATFTPLIIFEDEILGMDFQILVGAIAEGLAEKWHNP